MEKLQPNEDSGMGKPAKVNRVRFAHDTEALRAMGRAGAKQRMVNEDRRTIIAKHDQEKHDADEHFRLEQSGENIIPPNNID